MMETRITYKGVVIDVRPKELADGTGWTEDFTLEIHMGDSVRTTGFTSDRVFKTREEAVEASIASGKHKVDRSPILRDQPEK